MHLIEFENLLISFKKMNHLTLKCLIIIYQSGLIFSQLKTVVSEYES